MFDEATVEEAGRRILAAAPAGSRVILFGSYARGQAGKHSYLDFLVIEPEVEDWGKESVRLHRTLKGLGVWADVIVVSEHSVREWRDVYGTVIHAALSEGRELVACSSGGSSLGRIRATGLFCIAPARGASMPRLNSRYSEPASLGVLVTASAGDRREVSFFHAPTTTIFAR